MANVIQMGVSEFWRSLQDLQAKGKALRAQLDTNKLQLQHAWTLTVHDSNKARATMHQAALQPLIHNNSVLRLKYADMAAKFNQAVNAAAGVLRQAGFDTPNLAGPELLLVPVVAVAALGIAWTLYASSHDAAMVQINRSNNVAAIVNNANLTPAQRAQALGILGADASKKPPGSDPFNLDTLLPIAALVAAVVLLPPLLERLPRPRRAAA